MRIGVDIGGSHIAVAAINENGEIIEKIEQDIVKQENISQYILDYVDTSIRKLRRNGNIEEIGIVAPGNAKETSMANLVNLKIDKIDFKTIEEKYEVPLKTMNDAKAAAIAEKEYGSLKGKKDCVFLCLGTGIGGAVFLNNKLLQANRNSGFEIGHMVIEKDGIECKCGKKGCFETYCSMKRLKDKLKKVLQEKVKNRGQEIRIENAIQLKQQLKENEKDEQIQNIINEYIDNLIVGITNIIDLFEPEKICLGGSFVHFKDILYDKLVKEMETRDNITFNKGEIPKIVLAQIGNDAGLIGATLIK